MQIKFLNTKVCLKVILLDNYVQLNYLGFNVTLKNYDKD